MEPSIKKEKIIDMGGSIRGLDFGAAHRTIIPWREVQSR
jgi:hypothetical protein